MDWQLQFVIFSTGFCMVLTCSWVCLSVQLLNSTGESQIMQSLSPEQRERERERKNALHHGNNDVRFDEAPREESCVAYAEFKLFDSRNDTLCFGACIWLHHMIEGGNCSIILLLWSDTGASREYEGDHDVTVSIGDWYAGLANGNPHQRPVPILLLTCITCPRRCCDWRLLNATRSFTPMHFRLRHIQQNK